MKKYLENKAEIEREFYAPKHKQLKIAALAVISAVIAAELAMLFLFDYISLRTRLFIQGCAGVGAAVFVILAAIWAYRVYSEVIRKRYDK